MILNNKKYNLFIISIILIGFTLSNWAEYFHHHSHNDSNHHSCCGHSCSIEIVTNQIKSFKEAEVNHFSDECSLCKVIAASSFNYLINQITIDLFSKVIGFSHYQSINYTFQKILNLKNKSPPHKL